MSKLITLNQENFEKAGKLRDKITEVKDEIIETCPSVKAVPKGATAFVIPAW